MVGITSLVGVGEKTAKLLKKIGLETVEDIIENVPRKYDDFSHVDNINNLRPGPVTIRGRIHSVKARYIKRGLHITDAMVTDDTGSVRVSWFNQPFRGASIKEDQAYFVSGPYAKNYRFMTIQNPACELESNFPLHTARLVPQYKLTKGLSASLIRKITKNALLVEPVKESLPHWIVERYNLMSRGEALTSMHFPSDNQSLLRAKHRIGFEEIFELTLASELNKQEFSLEKAFRVLIDRANIVSFVESLPFALTDDQRIATWEILLDIAKGKPMNRLLEGDVGSGKTVVATITAYNVINQGYQVAFMAPTEILARQHFESIQQLLPENLKHKICILTGSVTKNEKIKINERIRSGEYVFVVGTHALIQKSVVFKNLAYIIIDEQHRFGVEQRKNLQAKSNSMPHVLHMTATPIPRSIALTLYGELDMSVLKHKPSNRQPVVTKLVVPDARQQIYTQVVEEIRKGRQAFVVCPLIQNNDEKSNRPLSVEEIATQIMKWVAPYRVEIIHGKMSASDKDEIMRSFLANKIHILVSTTVIEVGVDVPNASCMVIEGADKFGLAQLHQLRGRIGRGENGGICYLIPTTNDIPSKRLRLIESETDGFKLADLDLELRGPGALYGTVQHGALDLRVATLSDTTLIKQARDAAVQFVRKNENLVYYPKLNNRINRLRTITNLN
jgi:ATP-dependent DNA helicase RecG